MDLPGEDSRTASENSSRQRPNQVDIVSRARAVKGDNEVDTKALLPPRVVQQRCHLPMPSFDSIKFAVNFKLEKIHLLDVVAFRAVRVNDKSE